MNPIAFTQGSQIDLTEQYPFIDRHIGRPRLLEKDGNFCLIGRNYLGDGPDIIRLEYRWDEIRAGCALSD